MVLVICPPATTGSRNRKPERFCSKGFDSSSVHRTPAVSRTPPFPPSFRFLGFSRPNRAFSTAYEGKGVRDCSHRVHDPREFDMRLVLGGRSPQRSVHLTHCAARARRYPPDLGGAATGREQAQSPLRAPTIFPLLLGAGLIIRCDPQPYQTLFECLNAAMLVASPRRGHFGTGRT
jgi:hypothetical protein